MEEKCGYLDRLTTESVYILLYKLHHFYSYFPKSGEGVSAPMLIIQFASAAKSSSMLHPQNTPKAAEAGLGWGGGKTTGI